MAGLPRSRGSWSAQLRQPSPYTRTTPRPYPPSAARSGRRALRRRRLGSRAILAGGLLGTVAGVLIADYWILRRTGLLLAELYRPGGAYWYSGGWNWRAVTALLAGGLLAVGGSYSTVSADGAKQGPFPVDGIIPLLKPLADYGWAVGLASALLLYTALTRLAPPRRP